MLLGLVAFAKGARRVGVDLALEGAKAHVRERDATTAVRCLRLLAQVAGSADPATARTLEERAAELARRPRRRLDRPAT
jgi:hypothetical protein